VLYLFIIHLLTPFQLSAAHAATAAGIASSTAFARVAKAKSEAKAGSSVEHSRCTDPQAFAVLLKYAAASGQKVSVNMCCLNRSINVS
jgi:hypothetical protein